MVLTHLHVVAEVGAIGSWLTEGRPASRSGGPLPRRRPLGLGRGLGEGGLRGLVLKLPVSPLISGQFGPDDIDIW